MHAAECVLEPDKRPVPVDVDARDAYALPRASRVLSSVDVAICLVPGVWASSAQTAKDVCFIGQTLQRVGQPSLTPHFVAARTSVQTASGARLRAQKIGAGGDVHYPLIVLPSVIGSALSIGVAAPLAGWLAEQRAAGARLLSWTTGSWLLADADCLQPAALAATHWAFVEASRRAFPDIQWTAEPQYTSHDHSRCLMARSPSAGTMLLCHALRDSAGHELCDRLFDYALGEHEGLYRAPVLELAGSRGHADPTILDVQDRLEQRPAQNVSALAVAVGMSPRNLRRRFKAATDVSLQDYARAARTSHAKAALRTSAHSISELAEALGYVDATSFSAAFKRWTGLSPTAYRAGARADDGSYPDTR